MEGDDQPAGEAVCEFRGIAAAEEEPGQEARTALREFDAHACPGVPTVVIEGERFFGKDRGDWIEEACDRRDQDRA